MAKYTKKLIGLTGVSEAYATAQWYTLQDASRANQIKAAEKTAKRFNLIVA